MTVNANEELIRINEDYLEGLLKKMKAAYADKSKSMSDVDKISIDLSIDQISDEIKSTQSEIRKLKISQQGTSVRHRHIAQVWDEHLHKINYSRVNTLIRPIFDDLRQQEGSALFLLRKSRSMGGRWCRQKVKAQIDQELGSRLMPCEVGFTHHQSATSVEFLSSLAQRFAIDAESSLGDVNYFTKKLTAHIVDSLVSGDILFLEIDICTLDSQANFLEWFVQHFWDGLTGLLPVVSLQKRKIRLIALISVRGSIPRKCLPSAICCKKSNFSGSKILELPLQKWSEKEICNWLFDFSGLTNMNNPLADNEIVHMAKSIYAQTDGIPKDVYDELRDSIKVSVEKELERA